MSFSEELGIVLKKLGANSMEDLTASDLCVLDVHSKLGVADATLGKGFLFEHGVFVERNLELARIEYDKAWRQGSPIGAYNLGVLSRQEGRRDEAIEWFNVSANLGDSNAKICLAEMYLEVQGNSILRNEAIRLFDEAVVAGNPEACYRLAKLARVDSGMLNSDWSVAGLLKKACHSGHADSCYELGYLLWNTGNGKDQLEAREYFDCGAKLGQTLAMEVCIELFAFGNHFGLSRNVPKAMEYLSHKTMQNNPRALYVFACLTAEGIFVPRDVEQAKRIATRSIEGGCELAKQLLCKLEHEDPGTAFDQLKKAP